MRGTGVYLTLRMKGLPEHRPSATVLAGIAAAKKDRRWEATDGCTNATASTSREFCQTVDRLNGELGTATTAAALSKKLDELQFSIENLRKDGPVRSPPSIVWVLAGR